LNNSFLIQDNYREFKPAINKRNTQMILKMEEIVEKD